MGKEDVLEEVEMLKSIFGEDEITSVTESSLKGGPSQLRTTRGTLAKESASVRLFCNLPCEFLLEVLLPLPSEEGGGDDGYPDSKKPSLWIKDGPNASYVMALEKEVQQFVTQEVELGMPVLVSVVSQARTMAEEFGEDLEREKNALVSSWASDAIDEGDECSDSVGLCGGIRIAQGVPISDRKSKFLAHLARVSSLDEVHAVVQELRKNRSIASAAHPAIYAYRFVDTKNVLHQDADDDGEHGASKKILFLMDQWKADGYVVVVTRWFGGILLGPDRFKHIMNCVKDIMIQEKLVHP